MIDVVLLLHVLQRRYTERKELLCTSLLVLTVSPSCVLECLLKTVHVKLRVPAACVVPHCWLESELHVVLLDVCSVIEGFLHFIDNDIDC